MLVSFREPLPAGNGATKKASPTAAKKGQETGRREGGNNERLYPVPLDY